MAERIRRADPADARELARLRWDFRSTHGGLTETCEQFVDRCAAWMSAALADPRWTCFAAEIDGAIVGHLWIELIEKIPNPAMESERHVYVTNVYVRPEHRGVGVAGRLIDCATAWCVSQRVDTIVLWPSEKSRPLYARHGFVTSDAILARKLNP